MGVVYEAQHTVVRRRFAVKFLRRDLAERRDILTRFQREAEAAGALENENVTAAVDFGIADDGTPYIVMEYLVGESLAALLEREGRLPVARAADLVAQACRGRRRPRTPPGSSTAISSRRTCSSAAATTGPICVKVLDFGVAKLQALDEASAATRHGDGARHGRVHVARAGARRQAGRPAHRRLRAGRDPLRAALPAKRPTPATRRTRSCTTSRPSPRCRSSRCEPDLPAALVEIVGRALASDPAARPPSARRWRRRWRRSPGARSGRRAPRRRRRRVAALTSTALAAPAARAPPSAAAAPAGAASTANDRARPPAPPPRGPAARGRGRRRPSSRRPSRSVAVEVRSAVAGVDARSASPPPVATRAVPGPGAGRRRRRPRRRRADDGPGRRRGSGASARSPPRLQRRRPAEWPRTSGRTSRRTSRHAGRSPRRRPPAAAPVATARRPPPAKTPANLPPTFDPANPYR